MVICANEDLHVYGCGETEEEAVREFGKILSALYHSYRDTPLESLTEDAKKLRQQLCRLFE